MRDPERIQRILGQVQRIWEANPDLRLGQLLVNAFLMADSLTAVSDDYFQVEDEVLEVGLAELEQALAKKSA